MDSEMSETPLVITEEQTRANATHHDLIDSPAFRHPNRQSPDHPRGARLPGEIYKLVEVGANAIT